MSPELTTILMLASLLVLLAGFPIAFGVGTVGLVFGLITSGPAFLYMMPMRVMSGTLSEYILAAVPLFIFMGTMMQTSGVAERAFQVLHKWMSGVNGGLSVATVVLAILFAATTGVVGASETAIGLSGRARHAQRPVCTIPGQRLHLCGRNPGNSHPPQHHADPVRTHGRRIRHSDVCRAPSFRDFFWASRISPIF